MWLYPTIPDKIKKYYEDGYMIVIFTNQSKSWKHEQIKLVIQTLEIPVFIVIATDKCDYKPNIILFTTLIGKNKINKNASFYVGDAISRKSDFSDSDKLFAENINIPYYCPEIIFHIKNEDFEEPNENEGFILLTV
jgi:bifunctional polynucleotide phosphatase/kinase